VEPDDIGKKNWLKGKPMMTGQKGTKKKRGAWARKGGTMRFLA